MPHRYSTALSYIVLAGTGVYCYHTAHYPPLTLPSIGYGIVLTHSLIGIWRWGNPDYGDKSEKLYKWIKFLHGIFAIPCFIGQLYIQYGYPDIYGYIHPIVSMLPLCLKLKDDHVRDDLVDAIMALNVISGAVIGVLKENYWAVATAISFGFQYFALSKGHENADIPAVDLCNYALCFVCYFALRAYGA